MLIRLLTLYKRMSVCEKLAEILQRCQYIIKIQYYNLKMISAEEIKCNQCLQVFNKIKIPLKMHGCRHNLCSQCLQEIRDAKIDVIQCQFCQNSCTKINKKTFDPNRPLATKIQKQGDLKQHSSQTSNTMNNSFLAEQQSFHQQNQMLLTQQQPALSSQTHIKKLQDQVCSEHEKPLEIICVTDQKMICPHCAIFGNHKDHCFKTLKQFNKDFETKYGKLQIVKHKKYAYDKKMKSLKQKQSIEDAINKRNRQIRNQTEVKFKKLIEQIKNLQESLYVQLNKSFNQIYKDITGIFDQQSKLQSDYQKWQSQYQDCFATIDKTIDTNSKIQKLYGSHTKVEVGQDFINKLNKKLELQTKKVQSLVNSVSIQFTESAEISKLAKVVYKKQQAKKDNNFLQILQKINLPIGKHVVEEVDMNQNSFIYDYSRQDLSLILDGEVKRAPTKSVAGKRDKSKLSKYSSTTFRSPPHKGNKNNEGPNLLKVRSISNLGDISIMNKTESKMMGSGVFEKTLQIKDPSVVIEDFVKHDLKQVLDLSRCDLNDETLLSSIKQVRRHRKIRGLKVCQNFVTDAGLESIIQYIGATSNLNLSYNKLTEAALTVLINNRDKISPLRIVNMSFNNINEKKAKIRIDSLKKMGIIVNI